MNRSPHYRNTKLISRSVSSGKGAGIWIVWLRLRSVRPSTTCDSSTPWPFALPSRYIAVTVAGSQSNRIPQLGGGGEVVCGSARKMDRSKIKLTRFDRKLLNSILFLPISFLTRFSPIFLQSRLRAFNLKNEAGQFTYLGIFTSETFTCPSDFWYNLDVLELFAPMHELVCSS